MGSRKEEASFARELYAVLREFDDVEAKYIYSESFTSNELGQAIMNRLLKAAGYHVVQVEEGSKEG
jgi:L-threonylcarbamoyladenylate synthase